MPDLTPSLRGGGAGRSGRPEHGELVGDLQAPLSKPEQGAGPPSGRAGRAAGSGRIEHVAADEHALEVRRRDLVAERGGETANRAGARANPIFVYDSFARRRSRPAWTISR